MVIYVKKIVTLLFIIILISCSKNKELRSSEVSNSIDTVNTSEVQNNTKMVEIFHEDGSLKEKGKLINDTLKTGVWSYYKDGKLNRRHEYLYLDNSGYNLRDSPEYVNQAWFYDENEQVVGGSYYEIEGLEEEYNLGEQVIIKIYTPYGYFDELDSELFLLYKRGVEFDEKFANRNEIKFDTIWNATKSFPSFFGDDGYKFNILFSIDTEEAGDFKFSCILTEQASDFVEIDSVVKYRNMFLEIDFKVKDTIE